MIIGIIGGSGLDNPETSETLVSDSVQKSDKKISGILKDYKEIEVETPYGKPSSPIASGKISNVEVYIINRHGRKHEITPTHVNNRANIFALAKLGCKYILATSAVGSLKEEIKPGDFVIADQLIDFTKQRKTSFYDDFKEKIEHISLADPFSENLRKRLIESCIELGYKYHKKGTTITIEGPRFSTRAESNLFRSWNADVIGMTTAPEAALAREADVEYAVVCMSTDYDCWKQGEEDVTIEIVFERMKENAERVKKLIIKVIENISKWDEKKKDLQIIKESIRTIPNFPKRGIMFRDITTLMKNPDVMKKVINIFVERYKDKEIDVVAGIESRGFIFAAILSEKLNAKFVPVRKPGKLPAAIEREEYSLEYGKDAVEIHKDAISPGENVLLIDDLIATSGTMAAAVNLVQRLGGNRF